MKFTTQLTAGLLSLGLLTAASAEEPVKFNVPGVTPTAPAAKPATTPAAKPATPPAAKPAAAAPAAAAPASAPAAAPAAAPAVKYSDAELMEAFGYIFVLRTGVASQLQNLEITPAQKEAMVRGIGLALGGKELPYDSEQVQVQLQEFMVKRQETFLGKLKTHHTAQGAEYFAKLKENKNVLEMPSGLRFEIIKAGTGPVPKPGQIVTIHYTGAMVDGQVFDSTVERNQPPVDLLMRPATPESPQGIIAGMFEGLQKTGVGGKLKLHIPAALAYGERGNQAIPPAAALVFDVEIIGVKDAPPAPAAPAAK